MLCQSAAAGGIPPKQASPRAGLFKRLTVASILALACAATVGMAAAKGLPDRRGPSLEDDLPESVVFNWSGVYFGAHIGGAWSDLDWENESRFNDRDPEALPDDAEVSHSFDGVIGGGHFGFNKQFGHWVFGLEASLSGTDLSETVKHFARDRNGDDAKIDEVRVNTELDWLVLGAVRAGFTWDRWLGYVKGGFASGRMKLRGREEFETKFASDDEHLEFEMALSSSKQHHGWHIGAGIEFALKENVILGLEYNRIDLGGETHQGLATKTKFENGDGNKVDEVERKEFTFEVFPDVIHTVKARLSFKFRAEPLTLLPPLK
jgi:outer membrane immunogenic protein